MNNKVKFISYNGKWPNLCNGILTLEINNKEYKFGYGADNDRFWTSGGNCGFTNGYMDSYINKGDWLINKYELPKELQEYAKYIEEVFNENVPYGCCGGCL